MLATKKDTTNADVSTNVLYIIHEYNWINT